jgi:hypothetical protein
MVNRTTQAVKIFIIDGLTYRDEMDIFLGGLTILINSSYECAYGFQGLTKDFHNPTQLLTFYLLL